MKKIAFLTFLIIASNVFSQNVSVTDYDVPISYASNFRLNGFWNWAQVGDSVTANTLTGNLIYRRFFTSLPFAWFIDINATGGKDQGKVYSQGWLNLGFRHDIRIDASARKYIWNNKNWFLFSRMTVQENNEYQQIASDVTVGGGFGRYINATALAKAVRIEEHLIRENVLTDHLPKETIINIAKIIERVDEYQNLYGEVYETQWFEDIESEIRLSGVLVGYSIGAIGTLRMRQVLFEINEKVNQRYYGWDLSGGTLFTISTRDKSKAGSPSFSLIGRYSFPLSWRTQVNFTAEAFTPLDSAFVKKLTANANIDFIYELSNRVNFIASYRLQAFKPFNDKTKIDNSLNASFLFYIENNIYLGINTAFEKFAETPNRISTSLTLSYNLF
ncbi:MAG: hypothetical protein NTX22_01365 [Ignavibacteriales bacterium]|nr:hypothetical protein [Ignavibacteriales bacterium]